MENIVNQKLSKITELKNYLSDTDYHVLKQAEGGYEIPHEILFQRRAARENINALESEVEQLIAEMEVENENSDL